MSSSFPFLENLEKPKVVEPLKKELFVDNGTDAVLEDLGNNCYQIPVEKLGFQHFPPFGETEESNSRQHICMSEGGHIEASPEPFLIAHEGPGHNLTVVVNY